MGGMTAAQLLGDSDADIAYAAHTLARGELLGLPTETVYGLAADAGNAAAVDGTPSSCLPPWVDTTRPSMPAAAA